jgi:hypothetical protein
MRRGNMAMAQNDGWRSCPAGEFSRLAGRLVQRRHRQSAAAIALGIGTVLVTGIAAAAATQYVVDALTLPDPTRVVPRTGPPCDPLPPLDPCGEMRR